MKNINPSSTLEQSRNVVLVALAAKDLPEDQQRIPTNDSASESQLMLDVQTKAIVLRNGWQTQSL